MRKWMINYLNCEQVSVIENVLETEKVLVEIKACMRTRGTGNSNRFTYEESYFA